MTAADIAYGQRVRYQGRAAEIVDILRRVDRTTVQIRLTAHGQRLRWVKLSEIDREETGAQS